MKSLHLTFLVLLLCVLGLSTFFYKAFRLHFPLTPDSTSTLWNVEAAVSFESDIKPLKLTLNIPRSDRTTAVMDEIFISRGFGLTNTRTKLNRRAIWSKRISTGKKDLFYRAIIRKLETEEPSYALPPAKETKPRYEGAYLAATESLIEELRSQSADSDTFVETLIAKVNQAKLDENLRLLLGKNPDNSERAVVTARILNIAGIPARAAHGIRLCERLHDAPIEHWLEVYDQNSWHIYGRDSLEESSPDEYIVWWRGENPLALISGGKHLSVRLSVSRNEEEAIASATARAEIQNPTFVEYSLFRLPIQTQAVYRMLLLLPFGALVVVVLRNIIGIRTFGTFMPVLIAFAFRETQLITGLLLFSLLVSLGLAVRLYLEHLKLLMVPRLACVISVVVLMMAILSILTHKLGIGYGLSVSLFPVVILTMTIEHMSVSWEEVGPVDALTQGAGSLVAAAITYPILINRFLQHIIFVFPELLLVVIAVIILLGRYTGYRLLELRRFSALASEETH